jgi:hypothetical protein
MLQDGVAAVRPRESSTNADLDVLIQVQPTSPCQITMQPAATRQLIHNIMSNPSALDQRR